MLDGLRSGLRHGDERVVDEQAVTYLEDAGTTTLHFAPTWNAHELRLFHVPPRPDAHDRVFVGEDVVDDNLYVRSGGEEAAGVSLKALAARFRLRVVLHVLGGNPLDDLEVPLHEHLGEVTTHYFITTFTTHICLLI